MNQHSSHLSNSWIGRLIGNPNRYRLEERLGGGGMGEVFLATDTRLGRPVALKLLKESLISSEDLDFRQRFERECSICAALKSPHIVQVSDYGVTPEGYPFYVMEYLQGQTLGELLRLHTRLSIERACNIITQVCAGLQLAHEGIVLWSGESSSNKRIKVIHRDLKPANIFIVPTAVGELIKIIDFGIAKINSLHAEYTSETNVFLGTCHYAPPEQFDWRNEIDERADIYSLGIILYEMLAGIDPFGLKTTPGKVTNEQWLKAHLSQMPRPLRSQPGCEQLSPQLDAVVMKCLQKSPGDRFAAVADLSGALQAAVSGVSFDDLSAVDPTVSAPETTQLRAYPDSPKPAEANIATRVSSSVAPKPAKRGFSRLLIGAALLTVCAGVFFVPRLLQFPLLPGSSETAPNRQLALVETLSGQSGAIGAAILSTDGQTLISAGDEKAGQFYPVKIWDLKTKQVGRLLEQHTGVVRSLAISEDGRILASAGDDQTIRIWDLTTGQLIKTLEGHTAPVQSIALSPDGETLISSSEDKTVRVWDLRTGASRTLSSHTKTVFSVALSADGKTIASGGEDKTIKLWDVATGELIRTLGEPGGHREAVRSVAFSPDGQLLVSGGLDGFAKLWNAATGQLLQTFEGHRDRVVSVTFVNQQTVASASYDNTIKLWNVQTGQLIQDIPAHSNWVLSVTAQPTESMLVSSSSDTTVKIWR